MRSKSSSSAWPTSRKRPRASSAKIIGAMVYPAVVIFVAVAILTFIMVFIIPKFEKIFNDFGLKLPWADRRRSSDVSTWMSRLLVTHPAVPARRSTC